MKKKGYYIYKITYLKVCKKGPKGTAQFCYTYTQDMLKEELGFLNLINVTMSTNFFQNPQNSGPLRTPWAAKVREGLGGSGVGS